MTRIENKYVICESNQIKKTIESNQTETAIESNQIKNHESNRAENGDQKNSDASDGDHGGKLYE